MRADRLLQILFLLRRHGRLPARRLAELLEVSERTVLRDMDALSAAGVPVYSERGRSGGCVLVEGYTTDASGLTSGEA
ncbi:MAG: HTH domain-containing protein, partial [Lapillicoccus sp.]